MSNALKACAMLSLCAAVAACAGNSPDGLSSSLQKALTNGDVDGALALLDSPNIPSEQMFFYVNMLADCSNGATCTTKTVPLDEGFNKRLATQKQQGFDFAAAPEGLIQISVTGEGMKGSTTLPYAKVDGNYRILGAHLTAQKIAELQKETAQSKTEGLLKTGPGFRPDPEWKTHATALPPDGGEAGAALVALVKARTEAVKAGDVDKRIAVGDERDAIIYAAKSRATGKENSLKSRQIDMRSQAMRELADVKVLGGYQNGDTAILTIEGHDGHGWTMRGVQVMQQKNGKWSTEQADTVSSPAT